MEGEHLFLVVWAIGILLIWPPWFWWVIRSRRAGGYQMIPKIPPHAMYAEKRVSGSELGKLGGARNCLLVVLTTDEFVLTPTFPFNLLSPPRGPLGLVHKVSRRNVRASAHRSWRGNVRVELTGASYATIDLKLRDPERFLEALETLSI